MNSTPRRAALVVSVTHSHAIPAGWPLAYMRPAADRLADHLRARGWHVPDVLSGADANADRIEHELETICNDGMQVRFAYVCAHGRVTQTGLEDATHQPLLDSVRHARYFHDAILALCACLRCDPIAQEFAAQPTIRAVIGYDPTMQLPSQDAHLRRVIDPGIRANLHDAILTAALSPSLGVTDGHPTGRACDQGREAWDYLVGMRGLDLRLNRLFAHNVSALTHWPQPAGTMTTI